MKAITQTNKTSLKKFILGSSLILLAFCSHAQKGDSMTVNIWGDKLFCTKEMEDADNNGNEAFVHYHCAIVNADIGRITKSIIVGSLDIKMLFSGNSYPLNKRLFSEHPILENEILVVIPVAWEQDKGGPDALTAFNSNMAACLGIIASQLPAKYATLRTRYNNSQTGWYEGITVDVDRVKNLNWNSFTGLPSFKTALENVRGSGATRPVGISSNFEFTPAIFTFSRASMKYLEILSPSSSAKADIVQFNAGYVEGAVGPSNNPANYSIAISLQRKFIPAGGVIINPPIKKIPYQVGIWQGTWNVSSDPFLKMNISADGFFQLFDTYNTAREAGTYTMNADQFNGLITLNSKRYELTGNLDRTTATLSGTWRYNDGFTTRTGTWSVKK